MDLDVQFSNAVLPAGPGPWLRATFDDAAAGVGFDVRVTFETLGLTGTEFVSDWTFNVNPVINPAQFTFAGVNIAASNPIIVTHAAECCNGMGGGGRYDLKFAFPTPNGLGRFIGGETVVLDIDWTAGALMASDFAFLATPQGGNGQYYSAAHIQAIGNNSTFAGAATVTELPEPGLLALLGGGFAWLTRRRLHQA